MVAPPFPPFPAVCSQKRQAIKDRHFLSVSLSCVLQVSHVNTALALWDPRCDTVSQVQGQHNSPWYLISNTAQVAASSSQPQGGRFHYETSYFSPLASTHKHFFICFSTVLHIPHSCFGQHFQDAPVISVSAVISALNYHCQEPRAQGL